MDRARVTEWIAAYERAWRTAGSDALGEIFTPAARYSQGPYEPVLAGLPAIARMWEAEREGPDEVFTMTSELIAVDGRTAVARVLVRYGEPLRQEYRDLWVIGFAEDGRCSEFEEWPFWPGQEYAAR
jgi:hypothetical protein